MEWLKSFAEFLRTWQGSLALFGGGMTAVVARAFGYLKTDFELGIGALAAFGFWMLIAMAIDRLVKSIRTRIRASRLAERSKLAEATAAIAAEAVRGVEKDRAVDNVRHLQEWEMKSLFWIYHQSGHRARASINDTGIDGLVTLNLLEAEDRKQLATDRMWFIPKHVVDALRSKLGEPDAAKGKWPPPWEGRRGRIRI